MAGRSTRVWCRPRRGPARARVAREHSAAGGRGWPAVPQPSPCGAKDRAAAAAGGAAARAGDSGGDACGGESTECDADCGPGLRRAAAAGGAGTPVGRRARADAADPAGLVARPGKDTKTRAHRTVRLLGPLREDLLAWRLRSGRPGARALVFPGPEGRLWSKTTYDNWRERGVLHVHLTAPPYKTPNCRPALGSAVSAANGDARGGARAR